MVVLDDRFANYSVAHRSEQGVVGVECGGPEVIREHDE
jgi:hypothetical protein